jgi:hypothetical protein
MLAGQLSAKSAIAALSDPHPHKTMKTTKIVFGLTINLPRGVDGYR